MADVRLIETFDDGPLFAEAERIKKEFLELEQAASRAGQGMSDNLKKAGAGAEQFAQQVNKTTRAVMEANKAMEDGGPDALELAAGMEKLRKTYGDLQKAAGTLRTALKNATDPGAIALYSKELAKAEAGLKQLEKGAKQAGVSLKNIGKEGSLAAEVVDEAFGRLTKATVILFLIDQVYKLAKGAVELSNQYNKAKVSFTAFLGSAEKATQTIDSLIATGQKKFLLTSQVLDAGKALLAFGEAAGNLPDVLGRIADISAATGKNFNELALIYGKARTSGVLYAEDINQLVDAGIPIIQEFAKQLGVSNEQVKKLASEGKISFEELQLAFFNLTKEGGRFSDQAEAQATTLPGLYQQLVNRVSPLLTQLGDTFSFYIKGFLKDVNDLLTLLGVADTTVAKNVRATAESVKTLENLKNKALQAVQIDNNVTTRAAFERANEAFLAESRDFYEQRREQDQEAQVLESAAEKARLARAQGSGKDLQKEREKQLKDLEAYNKRRRELELQNLDPDSEQFAVAKENLRFEDQAAEFKKFNLETEQIEVLHQVELLKIRTEFEDKRRDQAQAAAKRLADIYDKANKEFQGNEKARADAALKEVERIRDIGEQQIAVQAEVGEGLIIEMRKSGASEERIREAERLLDLATQKARLENELKFQGDLLNTVADGDTKRIDEIVGNIELLKVKIANVTADAATPDKGGKDKPFSLFSLIGIDPDSDEGKGLQEAANQAVNAIATVLDAQLKAAEVRTGLRQSEYDDAKSFFEKQQELAKAGETNELAAAKTQLAQRKAALLESFREEQKIKRQQLALDSVTQLSGLITSSVNIFKALSPLGPFGVAAAIGTIALMFGSFAIAKQRALQAINQDQPKLRQGKRITGRPHSQGGETHVGIDGKRYEVEDREWVIGTEPSREHDKFLGDLNRGKFKGVNLNQLILQAGKPAPSPLAIAAPVMATMQRRHVKAKEQAQYGAMIKAYEKAADRTIKAIKEKPLLASIPGGYVEITETEGGRTRNFVEIAE